MSYTVNLIVKDNDGNITTTNVTSNTVMGFSWLEKLDNTLDIGSITLRGLSTSTPYTMFDTIQVLYNGSEVFSGRISGDNVSLISKRPKRYEHKLTLVEHTKILELFVISGKTFTQPTDGTITYYLYDVINRLRQTTPLEVASLLNTTRLFSMPQVGTDLYTILTTTPSPEFSFKELTLRECLNKVFDVIDAIPRLVRESDGTLRLSADFLNDLQNLITTIDDNFYLQEVNQDTTLYGTQIESEALNTVNDTSFSESVEIYPSQGSYTTARSDNFIFDFTRSYIPTPKPIYDVKKLFTRVYASVDYDGTSLFTDYIEVDLAKIETGKTQSRVVEFEQWKTLQNTSFVLSDNFDTTNFFQTNTIYFKFKEPNIIHNETTGLWGTVTAIELVIRARVFEELREQGVFSGYPGIEGDDVLLNMVITPIQPAPSSPENDYYFQVHYVPVPDATRINIDKMDIDDVDKNSVMVSNQQLRLINLENFANNMQGRINRIGNSDLSLSNRVSNPVSSSIYSIGDYTDDNYILTEKEWIFFNDYVDLKYALTKNFNKISDFIGVNSEIRQWEIGEKNLLNRDIVYKEYIEIDAVSSGNGSEDSKLLTNDGYNTYMATFSTTSVLEPVRGAYIDGNNIITEKLASMSSNGGGNSLIFNFRLPSNKTVGLFREDISSQIANNFASYTNSVGELDNLTISMFDKMDTPTTNQLYIDRGNDFPNIDTTKVNKVLLENNSVFELYKDNREIIGGTILLQQLPLDTSKVILGRWLSLKNRLVSESPPSSFKLYTYTTKKFGKLDNLDILSGWSSVQTVTPTLDFVNRKMTITHANLTSSLSSWALTDENDKILIAVNQDGTLLNTITFDFKNKRTGINYKY